MSECFGMVVFQIRDCSVGMPNKSKQRVKKTLYIDKDDAFNEGSSLCCWSQLQCHSHGEFVGTQNPRFQAKHHQLSLVFKTELRT